MQRGFDILRDPRLNKSTAFTNDERDRFGLHGLLPPAICTQKVQVQRAVENMRRKAYDIERFIYLQALQGRNERLFFRLIMDHLEEVMPLVYTPTVGQACQEFANIFRQTKGLYVSAQERGRVREIVRNWPESDVSVVVVTDGSGESRVPLLAGKSLQDGKPTAYVCHNFACKLPTTDPAQFAGQLREVVAAARKMDKGRIKIGVGEPERQDDE